MQLPFYSTVFYIYLCTIIALISSAGPIDHAIYGSLVSDLHSKDPDPFDFETSLWRATGLVDPNQKANKCGTMYLGGEGTLTYSGYFERTYGPLPSHNIAYFVIEFSVFDSWQNEDSFSISFDKRAIFSKETASSIQLGTLSRECVGTIPSILPALLIFGKFFHVASDLTIRVTSLANQHPNFASFGFRDINILLTNRTDNDIEQIFAASEPFLDLGNLSAGCGIGTYKNQSSNTNKCFPCHKSCIECFGPSSNECYACSSGATFNGTHCVSCNSPGCFRCTEQGKCSICESGQWLYSNGTCKPECSLPYIKDTTQLARECIVPCRTEESLLWNNSCVRSCDPPLIKRIEGEITFCDHPCRSIGNDSFEYYYEDQGICKSTCEYPYKLKDLYLVKICALEDPSQLNSILDAVASVFNFVTTFIDSSDSGSLSVMSLVKMLKHIKYLKINFPPKVKMLLKQQKSNSIMFSLVPEPNEEIKALFPKYPLSEKFEYYKLHSSFVINFWQVLMSLLVLLCLVCLTFPLERFAAKGGSIHSIIVKLKPIIRWNVLLTLFCGHYGDISLYSALEFRTAHFDNGMAILTFLVCVATNFLCLILAGKIIQVNMNLHDAKKSVPAKKLDKQVLLIKRRFENFRVFFYDFREDKLVQQIFLFIFILRGYLVNMMIGYFFNYPLFQTVLMTFLSIQMLLYLICSRPMKTKINQIRQFTYEIILLVLNVCLLVLAVLDYLNIEDFESRHILGEVIIVTNIAIRVLPPIFIVTKIFLDLNQIRILSKQKTKVVAETYTSNQRPVKPISPVIITKFTLAPKDRSELQVIEIENSFEKSSSSQKRYNPYKMQDEDSLDNIEIVLPKFKHLCGFDSHYLESQNNYRGSRSSLSILKLGQIDCGLSIEIPHTRREGKENMSCEMHQGEKQKENYKIENEIGKGRQRRKVFKAHAQGQIYASQNLSTPTEDISYSREFHPRINTLQHI